MRLQNELVEVDLDERWPRICSVGRRDTGGRLVGCDAARPFAIEVDGTIQVPDGCGVVRTDQSAEYAVRLDRLGLVMHFRFSLLAQGVLFELTAVEEHGDHRLQSWRIPDHRLITGCATAGDSYLRHCLERRNWGHDWCPGTGCYDDREDWGAVGDGVGEYGPRPTKHACVWNEAICAAFDCSIRVAPLLSELDSQGAVLPGRAGRFSVAAGVHAYRLRGELAEPFALALGILADANGDGRVDWCDAAGWEGDRVYGTDLPYRETIVYKLMTDTGHAGTALEFADCLDVIRRVHAVSGGLRQIVYLVGWQYAGHDTGYPSFDRVNPALGGAAALRQLIAEASAYNCLVSLHANVDDSYAEHPGHDPQVLSCEPGRRPFVWLHRESTARQECFSISHTLDVERGDFQRRMEALLAVVPLRETIHFDAHRPYNEVWTAAGEHISAECEVQRGMVPIQAWLRARGLDMTTEDTDSEKRGLYRWVWFWPSWLHPYCVAMVHGRLAGRWWHGLQSEDLPRPEGQVLGQCVVAAEAAVDSYAAITRKFYLNWMYAQVLGRRKMTGYHIGDWRFGLRAEYGSDSYAAAGSHHPPRPLYAQLDGLPIARGTDRFLPWRADVIYAYSLAGGDQEWTLPADWDGTAIACVAVHEHGEEPGPVLERDGRTLRYRAPAGIAIRLTRSATTQEPSR